MCTATKMVKPPIQVFGMEGRYATALYSAATKLKQLDQVEKDLHAFQSTLKEDKSLRQSIVSPIVNKKVMAVALKESADKLHMAAATGNMLGLLAQNGRLSSVDGIINAFGVIMAAHRGEVVCEVVTAKPLDSSQNKQLEGALKVEVLLVFENIIQEIKLYEYFLTLGFPEEQPNFEDHLPC